MQVRRIKFSELRNAYNIVKRHIEKVCHKEVNSTKLRIAEDLCLMGDDNYDLLAEMIKQHNLDFSKFEYDHHFVNEGQMFNSYTALTGLILLPFHGIKLIVGFLFYPFSKSLSQKVRSYDFKSIRLHRRNPVNDLTVGDLIASLIEKRFTLRKDVRYIVS